MNKKLILVIISILILSVIISLIFNRIALMREKAKVFFKAQKIYCGLYHSLALKSDGTLWTCGYNYHGELGTSDNKDRYQFTRVLSDVVDIAAGGYHSLALKVDGSVWVAGNNYYGQLGLGYVDDQMTFTKIESLSDVIVIACGM